MIAVCIFSVREMLDSGIPAHHLGQGLGSHCGLSEGREETGQLSRGETNRLGQTLVGQDSIQGRAVGQPGKWKPPHPMLVRP